MNLVQSVIALSLMPLLAASPIAAQDHPRPLFQPNISAEELAWARGLEARALKGDPEAQFNVSQALMDGHVFKQDWQRSIFWLNSAAETGLPQAEATLGGLYFLGKGVPRDYSKASYWTQRAADQGDVKAEYNLGFMYTLGKGVAQSNAEAVRWYTKSAEQGHQVAAYNLGIALSRGFGVPQDDVKAYMWFALSRNFGYFASQQQMDALSARLSPSQIAEARGEAQKWIKSHPAIKGVPL